MKRLLIAVLIVFAVAPLAASPINELRRLQDKGYSWQVYAGEKNSESAVCVELQKGSVQVEGCAGSLKAAVKIAEKKLRTK
jgi:hypothetical protein